MMFQRQHYEKCAAAITAALPRPQDAVVRQTVAETFALMFKADNERFDYALFFVACNANIPPAFQLNARTCICCGSDRRVSEAVVNGKAMRLCFQCQTGSED